MSVIHGEIRELWRGVKNRSEQLLLGVSPSSRIPTVTAVANGEAAKSRRHDEYDTRADRWLDIPMELLQGGKQRFSLEKPHQTAPCVRMDGSGIANTIVVWRNDLNQAGQLMKARKLCWMNVS